MVWADLIGQAAGMLISISFIPQLVRVYKLKSAYEISTTFTALLLLALLGWVVYGIYFRLWPVILWDSIGFIQVAILLVFKMKYGRDKKSPCNPKAYQVSEV